MTKSIYQIVVFLLLLIPVSSQGQSITDSGNQWFTAEHYFFVNAIETHSLRIGTDTTINNQVYKSVELIYDSLSTDWQIISFIREDNSNKVFYLQGVNPERVIYDFDLAIGDVFEARPECNLVVTEIDSIQLYNGELRKRLKLDPTTNWGSDDHTYWIEGIGSTHSLNNYDAVFCITDTYFELNCFMNDNELLYSGENANQCWITTPVNDVLYDTNVALSPNPFQDKITISSSEGHPIDRIQIFSSMGQLVRTIQISSNTDELDMSELGSGAYYILGSLENGDAFSKKLIKVE